MTQIQAYGYRGPQWRPLISQAGYIERYAAASAPSQGPFGLRVDGETAPVPGRIGSHTERGTGGAGGSTGAAGRDDYLPRSASVLKFLLPSINQAAHKFNCTLGLKLRDSSARKSRIAAIRRENDYGFRHRQIVVGDLAFRVLPGDEITDDILSACECLGVHFVGVFFASVHVFSAPFRSHAVRAGAERSPAPARTKPPGATPAKTFYLMRRRAS